MESSISKLPPGPVMARAVQCRDPSFYDPTQLKFKVSEAFLTWILQVPKYLFSSMKSPSLPHSYNDCVWHNSPICNDTMLIAPMLEWTVPAFLHSLLLSLFSIMHVSGSAIVVLYCFCYRRCYFMTQPQFCPLFLFSIYFLIWVWFFRFCELNQSWCHLWTLICPWPVLV